MTVNMLHPILRRCEILGTLYQQGFIFCIFNLLFLAEVPYPCGPAGEPLWEKKKANVEKPVNDCFRLFEQNHGQPGCSLFWSSAQPRIRTLKTLHIMESHYMQHSSTALSVPAQFTMTIPQQPVLCQAGRSWDHLKDKVLAASRRGR